MAWMAAAATAAAATLGGSLISANAAGDAADAQTQATNASIAEQRRQYEQNRADLEPWRTAGTQSLGKLSEMLGFTGGGTPKPMSQLEAEIQSLIQQRDANRDVYGKADPIFDQNIATARGQIASGGAPTADYNVLNKKFTLADFWDDPVTKASYQQGLDLGTKAIGNMAGARGNKNSGSTLMALTKFGTDYTGNQAAGSQARYVGDQTNTYNRLAGVAGVGQNAVNTGVSSGSNTASKVSNLLSAEGNARGAAAIAGGNIMGGAVSNIGNWWDQQQMLDKYLAARTNTVPNWNVYEY